MLLISQNRLCIYYFLCTCIFKPIHYISFHVIIPKNQKRERTVEWKTLRMVMDLSLATHLIAVSLSSSTRWRHRAQLAPANTHAAKCRCHLRINCRFFAHFNRFSLQLLSLIAFQTWRRFLSEERRKKGRQRGAVSSLAQLTNYFESHPTWLRSSEEMIKGDSFLQMKLLPSCLIRSDQRGIRCPFAFFCGVSNSNPYSCTNFW